MPFNPFPGLPLYQSEGDRSVVFYDDFSIDYAALEEQRLLDRALLTMEEDSGPPMPGGGGGGPWPDPPPREYPTNSLWLEMVAVTNAAGNVVLHGTVQDIVYELLSKEYLTNASWLSEGFWLGAANQNWTLASVPVGTRTNSLFLGARSWGDADGSGLPDWWEIQVFGTTGNDPYGDPDNDGWANIQEFQNGTQPTSFDTPPPPRNVKASLDWTGTNVIITWESGGGPVSGYWVTYYGYSSQLASGGPDLRVSTLPLEHPLVGTSYSPPVYQVHASFPSGSPAASGPAPLARPNLTLDMAIVRGPAGGFYLAVSDLPPSASLIRVFGEDPLLEFPGFDIPASNVVNGIYRLPDEQIVPLLGYNLRAQAIAAPGAVGNTTYAGTGVADEAAWATQTGFVDASRHVKENLRFLLRSANVRSPFAFVSNLRTDGQPWNDISPSYVGSPETYYARPSSPTNYEYSGFHLFSSTLDTAVLRERRPVEDHFLWRNFVYDPADFDSNWFLTNGASIYSPWWPIRLLEDPKYQVLGPATNPLPLAFSSTNSPWLMGRGVYCGWWPCDPEILEELGLGVLESEQFLLPGGVRNVYGLPLLSVQFPPTPTLVAGGPAEWLMVSTLAYPEAAMPDLSTADHYFASQTPYFRFGSARPPLPGSPDFTVTNTSPLLTTSVGQPYAVAGWAKQAILNGYANRFGYLEQYFDKAYRMTDAGVVTTNQTGLLSPYGEFFPTEPGPTALVTMPDIETGQRGTAVVHVLKLQLDVDHNGVMDLSFAGPDNTSRNRQFVFWVNGDRDFAEKTVFGVPIEPGRDIPVTVNTVYRDHNYSQIPSPRDLEDFARFWICGVPSLSSNAGYHVTLSWNVSSGNPAINLVRPVETNGGTLYLTDTNIALAQTSGESASDSNYKFARITPSQPYTFPGTYFSNSGNKCLLFEGAGMGTGELRLTIFQNGTNVLAQTSTWLDLRDVSDFFEHSRSSDVSLQNPPTTNSGACDIDSYQTANESPENHHIIIFAHGINNSVPDYENTSQTMFKRLYWQGYRGRFVAFRWPSPTWSLFPTSDDQIGYLNFNKGEYIAYQSAAGLKACIDDLRNRFPGYTINLMTHSLGVAVGNQAIRLGAQVDNYAMCQAAMSAWAFDGNNTNLIYSYLAPGPATPNADAVGGYRNAFADSTRRVNFYNEQDWALFSGFGGIWEGNQLHFRPDHFTYLGGYSFWYSFDGTNCLYREYDGEGNLLTSRTLIQDYEKKAYVARSRTKAVGAAGLVNTPHALTGGSVALNVNLQSSSLGFVGGRKFLDTRPEHSGEFTKNIQNTVPFYQQLLQTGFQISPNP